MPLATTVVGSYPKPSYLNVPDWFAGASYGSEATTIQYSCCDVKAMEAQFLQATEDVIEAQCSCGVDVVTDGEVRRENYIHYLCRFIEGIDFEQLTHSVLRNGDESSRLTLTHCTQAHTRLTYQL